MTLNTLKCNHLTPVALKGLKTSVPTSMLSNMMAEVFKAVKMIHLLVKYWQMKIVAVHYH